MYKYALLIVSILFVSSIAYAISNQETLTERVERENRTTLMECLDNAGKKSTTQEILQAKNDCSESILTQIVIPVTNTGIASGGIAPVPLGQINQKKITVNSVTLKYEKQKLSARNVKKIEPPKLSDSSSSFWKTYDLAIPLIRKHEGLRLKAYPDPVICSIGYGTRAKSCKEVITQAEADKRLGGIVKQLISRVQRDFPALSSRQQAGLVSFAYNCERGYRDVKKRGLSYHKYWCRTASGVQLQGLVNRRLEEQILIFE